MNNSLTLQNPTGASSIRLKAFRRTPLLGFALMFFSTLLSAQLTVTVSGTPPVCAGYTNGGAAATVTGGTAPYTYSWSTGSSAPNISSLAAGTYGVTVTDAASTTAIGTVTLHPPTAIVPTITFANICAVGTVTGAATGGTAPYTYAWDNGASGATIQPNVGGLTLTVTDANGCSASKWVNVPNVLTVTNNVTGLRCYGDCDAAIEAAVTGGTAPMTFNWTNGGTTQILPSLAAGNYGVTVRDANGCHVEVATMISNPTRINVATAATNATCGNSNGTATVTASGGVAPLTYLWSNGATAASISGLGVGTYTVTVTDGNHCKKAMGVDVVSSSGFTVTTSVTDAGCGVSNGGVTATPVGGTAPFQYVWSNGATTSQITGVPAAQYGVTVTDANNCTAMATATVSATGSLTILRIDKTDAACGIMNGKATVRVTGGTTPYTYLWSNGKTMPTIDMLNPGTYTVTVKDAGGCAASRSIVINQTIYFIADIEGSDTRCFGTTDGTATAMGMGGTPPYTYAWSNGRTTQELTNLVPGIYTVTMHDQGNCIATESIEIHQPEALNIVLTPRATTCGANNGAIQSAVTGGTIPYTYAWSNGATTAAVSDLATGAYTVTVTDDNLCFTSQQINVGASTALAITFDADGVACHGGNDGSATANVAGGTAPYTYAWSNNTTTAAAINLAAGTYTVTVSDASGCTKTGSITIYEPTHALTATVSVTAATCGQSNGAATVTATGGSSPLVYTWSNGSNNTSINGLAAGSYVVTVRDDNFCTTEATAVIGNTGTSLQVVLTGTNLNCFRSGSGAVAAAVTGGVAPLTYLWSNTATTQNVAGLQAGAYSLTVTDANGCQGIATTTITEPAAMNLIVRPTPTNCGRNNGAVITEISGGTTPYTYLWSNGATTPTITDVASGEYHVTVTDVNGCFSHTFATVAPSSAPSIRLTSTNVACNGQTNGTANAIVTGGIAPYTYLWSNSATSDALTGLAAGVYGLTVTDANNCVSTSSVTITQPAVLAVATSKVDALCGLANASATATVSGGTAPYQYTWSNGGLTPTITGLASGIFTIVVKDNNLCSAVGSVTVVSTPGITALSVTTTAVKCFGGNDGSAAAVATGGTAPYVYTWSNTATGATATGLVSGSYSVTVRDVNGCTRSETFTISQPTQVVVTAVEVQKATCAPIGKASATATGGTAPYRYAWSNNTTTAAIDNLAGGNYMVTVLDANNCRATATLVVGAITSPNLACTVAQTQAISDAGGTDGKATVTVTGSNGTLTYRWSNGQTTATATNLGALTYRVTVTDGNSCTTTCNITLQNPPCDNVTDPGRISTASAGYCPGGAIDPITNAAPATGGSGTLEYLWMYSRFNVPFSPNSWEMVRGQSGADLSSAAIQALNLTDTTYFIRCVRRNGCPYKESNQVTKFPKVRGEAVIPDPICVGRSVTFEAPNNGVGASIYSWSFGPNSTPSTATSRIQNVTFTGAGRQIVQLVINKDACLSVRSYPIDVVSCAGSGVELGAFKVTPINPHAVTVTWITRNELEQSIYTVERSADGGKTFEGLYDMPSQPAAAVNSYRWNDNAPKMGRSTYRIRRVGFGGTMNYSKQEAILMAEGEAKLVAYPNPTGEKLFVESLDNLSDGTLQVYNETGLLLYQRDFKAEDTRYEIDMTGYAKGLYLVKTRLNTGQTNVVRITKF
jgi:SprB repeat/Secretion system C-terminal sorting domain